VGSRSPNVKSSRSTLHEIPFVIVLLIELVAISSAAFVREHWLRAVIVMASGMFVAGLFRLVLSNDHAGLLRVRRRLFDVTFYWTVGLLACAFGLAVPGR